MAQQLRTVSCTCRGPMFLSIYTGQCTACDHLDLQLLEIRFLPPWDFDVYKLIQAHTIRTHVKNFFKCATVCTYVFLCM